MGGVGEGAKEERLQEAAAKFRAPSSQDFLVAAKNEPGGPPATPPHASERACRGGQQTPTWTLEDPAGAARRGRRRVHVRRLPPLERRRVRVVVGRR